MKTNIAAVVGRAVISALAACTALLASASGGTAVAQTLTPIPVLPSQFGDAATDISANGTAVSGISGTAYRWTPVPPPPGVGTTQNLGALTIVQISDARGISNDGLVLAGTTTFSGGVSRAYRWTSGTGMVQLGTLPGGAYSSGWGISGDGTTVVGHADTTGVNTNIRAFRWTSGTGMVSLGTLPAPFNARSECRGVSANGSVVVGFSQDGSGNQRAFRWTQAGGMVDLGLLPAMTSAIAWGVSDDGTTVVGVQGSGLTSKAFRWTQAGGLQDLGNLGVGGANIAYACSPDGTYVVGTSFGKAFLWSADQGMINLNTRLAAFGINMTGVSLTESRGISADLSSIIFGGGGPWGFSAGQVVRGMPCLTRPTPTSGPADTFVCAGQNIVLTASGTGQGTITYQWTKNNVPVANGPTGSGSVISGATSPNVVITNAQGSDTGLWNCIISNQCGSAAPSEANVAVFDVPVILTEPADTSVCAGNSAVFNVVAGPATSAPFAYQWERQVVPGPVNVYATLANGPTGTGSSVSGANTATLTVSNFGPSDQRRYRCLVTSACGSQYTVRALGTVAPAGSPTIDEQITAVEVCAGSDIALPISATPPGPSAPLSYQWWQVLGSPPFQFYLPVSNGTTGQGCVIGGASTATLTFSNAQLDAAGVYFCVVSSQCGSAQSLGITLTVIAGGPTITQNPTPVNTLPNATISFTATATGPQSPPTLLTYIWRRYGVPVANGPGGAAPGGGTVSGAGGAVISGTPVTLTITGVQGPDGGSYDVVFINTCRQAISQPADLLIQPPQLPCNPADIADTAANPGSDYQIDNGDFSLFFSSFFSAVCPLCGNPGAPKCGPADIADTTGNPPDDGCVDNGDFSCFFTFYFQGCP